MTGLMALGLITSIIVMVILPIADEWFNDKENWKERW